MSAQPFLKYVGGKRRVLPYLNPLLPETFGRYVEPFVGGGALFFHLAARQPMAGRALISDANPRLVKTYRAVQGDVEGLIARLQTHATHHDRGYYLAQRDRMDLDSADDTDVGAWMIYINKTGFNGLYRVNRKGKCNTPFGDYARPRICDADNLRACSAALAGVMIWHADFADAAEIVGVGDLVYFDPPYVPLSKTANFRAYTANGFGTADQTRVRDQAARLANRGAHVLLSNTDNAAVRELYGSGFDLHPIQVGRSVSCAADRRGKAGELVIVAHRVARQEAA